MSSVEIWLLGLLMGITVTLLAVRLNFEGRIFRPAVKRFGYAGVGFHHLRHTTASLLISQGTPITTVAGILGHASTQMTLNVYGHLYEDESVKYVDRLGDSIFNTGTDKERTSKLIGLTSTAYL